MRIYNTLTRHLDELPLAPAPLNMFVCGPTVFDYIHIGNARPFTFFDSFAKYLRYQGYKVYYLQNITDVDDKIIRRAGEKNTNFQSLATFYEKSFLASVKKLKISDVHYIRATDHIPEIIKQVQTLIDKGYGYEINDGIYYDLSKFKDYGKLSGRTTLEADDAVSRIDENPEKRNPGDFCLWKRSKPGEPTWDAPWFPGRPGWHIEDTAMTESVFGPQYDIHGGGQDLIFPHHEAEIAQQEAASGKAPFVKHWMHTAFLVIKNAKMSKSLGNFSPLHELLQNYAPEALRFYLLSAHYRSPLDFSDNSLKQAEAAIMRISEFLERLRFSEEHQKFIHQENPAIGKFLDESFNEVIAAMDDDLNTPKAIGAFFDILRTCNQYIDQQQIDMHSAKKIMHILDFFDHVFGIVPVRTTALPKKITDLVKQRQEAKDAKDYLKSDLLRTEIESLGYSIDDTPYGPLVKKK